MLQRDAEIALLVLKEVVKSASHAQQVPQGQEAQLPARRVEWGHFGHQSHHQQMHVKSVLLVLSRPELAPRLVWTVRQVFSKVALGKQPATPAPSSKCRKKVQLFVPPIAQQVIKQLWTNLPGLLGLQFVFHVHLVLFWKVLP